ncbi:MAG: prepilin-type N-terminal cleavage/methylation domain-containing protein [Desulfobulbaceae bacterium]|nr:prepilin-type N-terminal cleavage/methylation domain-containing protein [Desulfobulbaceae bacterium]
MQRATSPHILSRDGFTTIEVIAALLLIAVLAAVVVSRMADTSADLAAESEIVKAHLRFVQSRAMNSDVSWGVRFDGGSYTMLTDGLTSSGLLPNENASTHTLAVGSVSASTNPVLFDEWGSPGVADIVVTVGDGSGSKSFVISKNTGFIP